MKSIFKWIRRLLFLTLIAIFVWAVFNYSLVIYGFDQLKGQLKIINGARPLSEVINDNTVSDTIKQRIYFIDSVRRFAIDTLKLKDTENYTTFYDQHDLPLLWVLTASEPFELKPYEWSFPLLGSVSYKGFFDYEDGAKEKLSLIAEDYDVDYGEVSAWSTLGWFKDPILSSMINKSKGQLAELIIHEMTHSTLYLKSNVDVNENLASVCGEQGAIHFLTSMYGDSSKELKSYLQRKEDYDRFSKQMLIGTQLLDSLYKTFGDSIVIIKKAAKNRMIKSIIQSFDTISFNSSSRYKGIFKDNFPNNADFLSFVRYDSQKDEMKRELVQRFNGNIHLYIEDLRKKN
jgi:predicted aminopeptidase